MDVKGVFFDLYGTLMVYGDMDAAWGAWYDAFHRYLSPYGVTEEQLSACIEGFYEWELPPDDGGRLTMFERRVDLLCRERLGIEVGESDVKDMAAQEIESWSEHVWPDPEAYDVLSTLGRAKALALVSNFDHPPHIHSLLRELDYRRFFETVVISGDVGVQKPDPRIMYIALDALGLRPEETVYIGDSAEDMEAAHAAGMRRILIRRESSASPSGTERVYIPYSPKTPNSAGDIPVVARLSELPGILVG